MIEVNLDLEVQNHAYPKLSKAKLRVISTKSSIYSFHSE